MKKSLRNFTMAHGFIVLIMVIICAELVAFFGGFFLGIYSGLRPHTALRLLEFPGFKYVFSVIGLILIIWFELKHFNLKWDTVKGKKIKQKSVFCLILLLFGSLTIVNSILYTYIENNESIFTISRNWLDMLILVFITCLLAPIVEEILFRGIIFKGLYQKYNYKKALIWSAFFFWSSSYLSDSGGYGFYHGAFSGVGLL